MCDTIGVHALQQHAWAYKRIVGQRLLVLPAHIPCGCVATGEEASLLVAGSQREDAAKEAQGQVAVEVGVARGE